MSAATRANPAFEADAIDELNLLPTFHAVHPALPILPSPANIPLGSLDKQ
jgi:hypothetical protein